MEKHQENRQIEVIHSHLQDAHTSWSIGTFGAIGEFHLDPHEQRDVTLSYSGGETITKRGALRVNLPDETRLVPYEQLSRRRSFWLQGANFCLPQALTKGSCHTVLTETGPDLAAIRPENRDGIVFDLGLTTPHISVCIRTDDIGLIKILRTACGRSLFEKENPAMRAIKNSSPHRVFISDLGRVEIYQHIGSTEKGIPSPQGPHTHILPNLLKHNRTHSANVPVPNGYYPCLSMYPPNPLLDNLGEARIFDEKDHRCFQNLLNEFGDPVIADLKSHIRSTVMPSVQGVSPDEITLGNRQERAALRITLRQLAAENADSIRMEEIIQKWQARFEPATEEEPSDHHGH